MINLGKVKTSTERSYYAKVQEPNDLLVAEGYTFDGGKVFEWTSKDGLISASIRRCSKGWYVLYIA